MCPLTIAAVIPVYNRARVVLEALESTAKQSLPPQQLVIVDDGSTDATARAVRQWIDRHRLPFACRLITQRNAGVSAARNRGVAAAMPCDLLAFLDSDDLWPADYLLRMHAAFEAHPQAVGASCDTLRVQVNTRRQELHRLDARRLTTQGFFTYGPPSTPNTVFRASSFHQVGGYSLSERCGEDYQLALRLSLLGRWLAVPGEPVRCRSGTVDAVEKTGQLSSAYADRRWRLAKILDRFAFDEGGAAAMQGHAWERRLGRLWYSAGRQLASVGRSDEAHVCFQYAVQRWPWHLRARCRSLLS